MHATDISMVEQPPSFSGRIGVGRRDITPPVEIYSRSWGAAKHDVAEGIHQPFHATVLTIQPADGAAPPLVLASIDAGWYRDPDGETFIRQHVLETLRIDARRLMIALTHTHAGPSISFFESEKPGGHLIRPYLERLREAIAEASREALATAQPATITCATGRCGLAANRDLPDPGAPAERVVCGYNPVAPPADDAVLVGRVTRDSDGAHIATIVNYACHPTILAWENRLLSPEFIGPMRQLIESHTNDASCLFLQGASGELGVRQQHTSDMAALERAGRQLGYTVLSALESMLPPRQCLAYSGVTESGAPLALWRPAPYDPPTDLQAVEFTVDLPLKPDLPTEQQVRRDLETCDDRTLAERLRRRLNVLRTVGPGPMAPRSVWAWRLGRIVLVGHADEAYSHLQIALRRAWPDHAVFVMNLVNGSCGYLAPRDHYDLNVYQVWQSPFGRGSMELLIERCTEEVGKLVRRAHGTGAS